LIEYVKCSNCDTPVQSYETYDAGYHEGYRSRNYITLVPFEKREILLPEYSPYGVVVCQKCIEEDPSLKELKHKLRLEWYEEKIATGKKRLESLGRKRVDFIKKEEAMKAWIVRLLMLERKIKKWKSITGKDVPKCPVEFDLSWYRKEG